MWPLKTGLLVAEDTSGPTSAKDEDNNTTTNLQDSPQINEHLKQELAGKFCDFASKSHEEIRKNLSPGGLTFSSDGGKALELGSFEALLSDWMAEKLAEWTGKTQ